MNVKSDDPETETDLRSWTALSAEVDTVEFVGIEGLTAEGGVAVEAAGAEATEKEDAAQVVQEPDDEAELVKEDK